MPTSDTITGNSKVTLSLLIAFGVGLVSLTAYVVTIQNTQEVHERRLTATELRQDESENNISEIRVLFAGVITKLDILLQISGYAIKPPI